MLIPLRYPVCLGMNLERSRPNISFSTLLHYLSWTRGLCLVNVSEDNLASVGALNAMAEGAAADGLVGRREHQLLLQPGNQFIWKTGVMQGLSDCSTSQEVPGPNLASAVTLLWGLRQGSCSQSLRDQTTTSNPDGAIFAPLWTCTAIQAHLEGAKEMLGGGQGDVRIAS